MEKKILLIGEPMALLIAETTGSLEKVEHYRRSLAGAEVNVAIGVTRLGHTAEYLTRLGEDPFGHFIENELKKNNICTDLITYDSIYKTGIQLKSKVTDGSDPITAYYRKGSAASHITSEEIDKIDFSEIGLLHVTGIPPALSDTAREATFHLLELAKKNHVFISFDPNLRPSLWESKDTMIQVINQIASYADLILPGLAECKILIGTENLNEIAEFYHKIGVQTVIIKVGSKGAWIHTLEEEGLVPGYQVDHVVDTVGAGDGFAVGVITGILEKLSMHESVQRGNAIGAIQVMNVSDNEGLPTKEELNKFMKEDSK